MKRPIAIREEIKVVEQMQRIADAEGLSLSAVYRRAARLFLSTLPKTGNTPKEPEQVAA